MARNGRSLLLFFGLFFTLLFPEPAAFASGGSPPPPSFREFYQKHSPAGVSLIFSTHYLNNPASAFGHTFLRIHRKDGSSALLDQGVNYAALYDPRDNALAYSFKGLFGGYPGQFTSLPFFYKVREYNDLESRDLWEYRLNLTQEELDRLIEVIWEMSSKDFKYYYLSENCSYRILQLIEMAAPRFKLMRHLHSIVIPLDTLHALMAEPGLVSSIHFEPSLHRQLQTRFSALDSRQKKQFWSLIQSHYQDFAPLQNEPPASAAAVLDAVNDWIDYRMYRALVSEEPAATAIKNSVRRARAKLGTTSPDLIVPTSEREAPHFGHRSNRLGLMAGRNQEGDFLQLLEFRFAYHDLLDPSQGFSEDAQIEMGKLRVRHEPHRFHLDEVTVIRVLSLNPWNLLQKGTSWALDVGGQRSRNPSCIGCTEWGARGGSGFSVRGARTTGLALIEAQALWVPHSLTSGTRAQAGISPRFEIFVEPIRGLKLGALWNWTRRFPKPAETYWNGTVIARAGINQNTALDFQWSRNRVENIVTGGAYFYF